jgi:hypothetical protein
MTRSSTIARLGRDQRGTVIVVSIFMVMILAGSLFYLSGNGAAIEHRNNGQGAADGAAYSSAVVHATAMNNLALLNMMKLGATASLTHLRSAQIGAASGAVLAGLACIFDPTACAAATMLSTLAGELTVKIERASRRLEPLVEAADAAQGVLMTVTPLYGIVRMEKAATSYPGVHGALPTVFSPSLPVDYESEVEWCTRVIKYLPAMYLVTFTSRGSSLYHLAASGLALAAAMPACMIESVPGVKPLDDARLGSDAYQLQSFTLQSELPGSNDHNIQLAAHWWGDVEGGEIDRRRKLYSRMHFAQAEYYLDGGGSPDQLLWSMKWKARLTQYVDTGGYDSFEKLCQVRWPGAPCADLRAVITETAPLTVH